MLLTRVFTSVKKFPRNLRPKIIIQQKYVLQNHNSLTYDHICMNIEVRKIFQEEKDEEFFTDFCQFTRVKLSKYSYIYRFLIWLVRKSEREDFTIFQSLANGLAPSIVLLRFDTQDSTFLGALVQLLK